MGSSPETKPIYHSEIIRTSARTLYCPEYNWIYLWLPGMMAQGLLHFWCFWLCLKSSLVHSVLWGPKGPPIYKQQREGIHHIRSHPAGRTRMLHFGISQILCQMKCVPAWPNVLMINGFPSRSAQVHSSKCPSKLCWSLLHSGSFPSVILLFSGQIPS